MQAKFTTSDIPVVIQTENQTPTPASPETQNQNENQPVNKIEYLPPTINSPSVDENFYLFNSVGDVFGSFFKYIANIGRFLSGDNNNSTNSPAIEFQWADTNKISNPNYVLDLSKDDQFSNIVLEKNISSQSYSLPDNTGLSSGSYFWRVKTVDSVGNASNWSATSGFTIGSMPGLVALFSIVISILILAAILFAIFAIRASLSKPE